MADGRGERWCGTLPGPLPAAPRRRPTAPPAPAPAPAGVQFSSPPAAGAPGEPRGALPDRLHVRLGLLSQGGTYTAPALELPAGAAAGVLIKAATCSALSARCAAAARGGAGGCTLELTYVAERPGPCEETLTAVVPGRGEVRAPPLSFRPRGTLPALPCPALPRRRGARQRRRSGARQRRPARSHPSCAAAASAQVEVRVTATVMPRSKGTPQLRPTVRCIGFAAETDLDA
jgi:hypothetical protein